jgi:hypothetical protein
MGGYGTDKRKARALTQEENHKIDLACDLAIPEQRLWLTYKAATSGFGLRGGEPRKLSLAAVTYKIDSRGRRAVVYDPEHTKSNAPNAAASGSRSGTVSSVH